MSDQDTQKTQPSLTTTEIMTIILGCEQMMKRSLPPTKVSAIAPL